VSSWLSVINCFFIRFVLCTFELEVISIIPILQNFYFVKLNYFRKKKTYNYYLLLLAAICTVKLLYILRLYYDNNYCRTNFPDAELVCLIGNNSAVKFLTLSSVKPFERHAARLKPATALMLRKCLTIGPGDRSPQWYYREIPRADASPVIRVTVHLRTILCHCCGARLKPANNFHITSVIAAVPKNAIAPNCLEIWRAIWFLQRQRKSHLAVL